MTKRQHPYRPAGVALVAALALAPTPMLAQAVADAAPLTAEPAPPPIEPVATPVEAASPAADAAATVQPLPAPSATPVTTTVTTRKTAPARTTAPQARSTVPVRATTAARSETSRTAQAPSVAAAEPPPAAVAVPAAAPAMAESTITSTTAPTKDNSALIATVLAALAVFGLALWGFVAIGRRKRADERFAIPVVERPIVAEPQALAAVPVERPRVPTPAPSMAHGGASVPLPRRLPDTFEERDALLKRMIDARPDRANPFTNRRARLRRARLILQSLDRDFADRKSWIDFSQYPGNWPELSRNQYAAA